MAQNNAINMS